MKKWIAMLLALTLLVGLTACGGAPAAETPDPTQAANSGAPVGDQNDKTEEGYFFTLEGEKLIPGAAFDPSAYPEANSVYEVPSCAIEGTDNLYDYGTVEVTAYDDGTGEIICSVYLVDANGEDIPWHGFYGNANGGYDNRALITWEDPKEIQLNFTQGVFSARQFALLSNANLVEI